MAIKRFTQFNSINEETAGDPYQTMNDVVAYLASKGLLDKKTYKDRIDDIKKDIKKIVDKYGKK